MNSESAMDKESKIYVAGHNGMVGSAVVRKLTADGYRNLVMPARSELDLEDQRSVAAFFERERPEFIFLAAAKVGGILANDTHPADFLYSNLAIECNVIHSAFKFSAKKLLFLGSSCIYPKESPQPIREEYLLSGPLEPTNEAYAVAKIAGIKLCQSYNRQHGTNFISVMPTNLYGPNDNFDLTSSHVLPALIAKFDLAKKNGDPAVTVWGTGNPRREFLHVDDLAEASVLLMNTYTGSEIINIGVGKDISIAELAHLICGIVGYEGEIVFDTSKPDGMARKLLDVSRMTSLGWKARISLPDGIDSTYRGLNQ